MEPGSILSVLSGWQLVVVAFATFAISMMYCIVQLLKISSEWISTEVNTAKVTAADASSLEPAAIRRRCHRILLAIALGVATVTAILGVAVASTKRASELSEDVESLQHENADVRSELLIAERGLRESNEMLSAIERRMSSRVAALAEVRRDRQEYEKRITDLQAELSATQAELYRKNEELRILKE